MPEKVVQPNPGNLQGIDDATVRDEIRKLWQVTQVRAGQTGDPNDRFITKREYDELVRRLPKEGNSQQGYRATTLGGGEGAPGNATTTTTIGALETRDEGVSLSTAVTVIDFVGAGVTASGAGNTTTVTIPGVDPGAARIPMNWSDGADGSVVFDGTNTFAFASKTGSVYTLTRNVAFVDCTINAGVTVKPGGCGVWVNGTFANYGDFGSPGGNAVGPVGGAIGSSANLYGGSGSGGVTATGLAGGNSTAAANSYGGSGGNGGAGATAGGTGGIASPPTVPNGGVQYAYTIAAAFTARTAGTATTFTGGTGGAAGGGDGNGGGGGGGGGACFALFAKNIAGNGTISCKGGNGGAGAVGGTNCGGGGGGGGGWMAIFTTTANYQSLNTVTVAGGTGGVGGGAGAAGANGGNGRLASYICA